MSIPFAAIEFTKSGAVADEAQVTAALQMLHEEDPSDVLLLAHGWNNDMDAARRLYDELMAGLAARLPAGAADDLAVIGIFWPSVRWADEDQIAGGGVSVGDDSTALWAAIEAAVDDSDAAERLKQAAGALESADNRAAFVDLARRLLPGDDAAAPAEDEDQPPATLISGDPDEVFAAVRDAVTGFDDIAVPGPGESSGAPGMGSDLLAGGDIQGAGLFGQSWGSLARQVLNTFTYYTMKARAGAVGAKGVAALIDRIHAESPDRRVHLAGHSFGARVVSAAAAATTSPVASVTLLQGAFSHYGFTQDYAGTGNDGAFVPAVADGHITGPLVITHTHNDRAVGLAYAIASRLARQTGAGIGDESDLYGGIGANGSVGAGATATQLQSADARYSFAAGSINNVLADQHISGHSDVTNAAVVNVLAHAMGLNQ